MKAVIVEDDARLRAGLAAELRDEGLEVEACTSAEQALGVLVGVVDLLLADVRLPGRSGVDLVRGLAAEGRLPPTVLVSGEATISETVEGLRAGVLDFLEKPFSRERLHTSVRNALARAALEREISALRGDQAMLGDSPAMAGLRDRIARAAPLGATVLVCGESGTGKELVVAALHAASPRRRSPLFKVNCAAIPGTLVEDELFGHARGAFTGAATSKAGLFEEAHGGTLFLDEIGDMELPLQARLLRVLEDGRVRRLGETRDRVVDVRVLAATNQDLESAVREKCFREDLFFRLAHLVIDVPPLRSRSGDLRPLAQHFLARFSHLHRMRERGIEDAALAAMERHSWPGNVRELRNLCERLVVFGGDPITLDQLPPAMQASAEVHSRPLLRLADLAHDLPLRELRERCEREYVAHVLERCGWSFTAAAAVLGVQRTYLHEKAAALGLRRPK